MSEVSNDGLQYTTSIIERVASSFSLLGSFIIIISFTCSTAFHRKPINRLIFYAAFGNVLSNVSTLIAGAYINEPDSASCQFQAALIQTFVPADAYWALAMAVNVWLTFYRKSDADGLRKMEKWYFSLCYGSPMIPGIVMVFVKGRPYGNAKLWCWIRDEWPGLRFATFYGPVWVAIVTTFFIYSKAGRDVYAKRKQLQNFGDTGGCQAELLTVLDPFSTKTTEIVVTSEPAPRRDLAANTPSWRQRLSVVGAAHTTDYPCSDEHRDKAEHPAAYSITISANTIGNRKNPPKAPSKNEPEPHQGYQHSKPASMHTASISSLHDSLPTNLEMTTTTDQRTTAAATRLQHNRAAVAANSAAWSYTKCAMLFFTASIITWLPPTSNRLYNLISGGESSPALEYMTAFVLPMQGFWNCIIYCFTSRESVKLLLDEIKGLWSCSPKSTVLSSSASSLTSPRLLSHSRDFHDRGRGIITSRSKREETHLDQYELAENKEKHDPIDQTEGSTWEVQPSLPRGIHRNPFYPILGVDERGNRCLVKPPSLGSTAGSLKEDTTESRTGISMDSIAELTRGSKKEPSR